MTLFIIIITFCSVALYIVMKSDKFVKGEANPESLAQSDAVQELKYFNVKDKGYHVTVWPKNSRVGEVLEFDIAGMSYRGNLNAYVGEHAGTLEAEPDNQYDPNAIKILAEDGHHVGYVPQGMTAAVRKLTSLPCQCYFYIGSNNGTYFSASYITI